MIVESYDDVIVLSGALRSNFWETIHTAISLTLKRHPSGVIVDCSAITECTPAGAETFRDAMEFIDEHDARIIVAAVPPVLMDVLKTVPHVRSQLPIAQSVELARRSLDLIVEGEDEGKKKKLGGSPLLGKKVLVCLSTGTSPHEDDAAMRLGLKIAQALQSEIILVCVLLVPRDLPLQAPLSEQEESAAKAVDRAHAFYDTKTVLNQALIERGRDIASTLGAVLEGRDVSYVVLPLSTDVQEQDSNAKLVKSVLAKVQAEVIFVRGKEHGA